MNIAYRAFAYLVLVLALVAGGFVAGHHIAAQAGVAKLVALQAQDAKALAAQQAAAALAQSRALVRQQADEERLAHIQQTYEQDKAHAKAQSDATIASLRAGTLRLRHEWNTCTAASADHLPEAAAGGPGAAGAANLRFEDASALVRAADEADAEIKALQAIVIQDRQP